MLQFFRSTAWVLFFVAPAALGQEPATEAKQTPNSTWEVHDPKRPMPEVVESSGAYEIPAPAGATVLFDGSDLKEWWHMDGSPGKWKIEGDELIVQPGTGNIQTMQTFHDVHLHLEWMVPESEAKDEGQARGNSGVFLMGLYEVQVLESAGSSTYADGMGGALYGQFPPQVNAGAGGKHRG